MPYQSEQVASIVKRLNQTHFLPAIQREFVWEMDQIVRLFDSLMRDYPIQAFLFWEVEPENRDRWDIYKFFDHFSQKDPHNPPASTDGIQNLTLVLDGQQRLTSLLIGLKGSFTVKKKWKRRGNPDAWSRHTLYLDLLKDASRDVEGDDTGVRYGFQFLESQPVNSKDQHWFKVGRILDCQTPQEFQQLLLNEEDKLHPDVTRGQSGVFRSNLMALYSSIWTNNAISFRTEASQDLDRVLDVFVRVNEGGTKLSKSDLLLSTVTAHWEGINARDEINNFVERLNHELPLRNKLDKDFIMKACLVLTDLEVQYRVDNFRKQNLAIIRNAWERLKTAIEATVRLVNSFGIDQDSLTSANALIPVAYYFFHHPNLRLDGSSQAEAADRQRILRWLASALLTGAFGRAGDTVLSAARNALKQHQGEDGFPIDALVQATLRGTAREASVIDVALETTYWDRTAFLALAVVYDEHHWSAPPHKDHIFPQALFTASALRAAGIPASDVAEFQELQHSIGNLELLVERENTEKAAKPFAEWICDRDEQFRQRHLIPDDERLYDMLHFPEFVAEREKLLRQRLETLFGDPD